MLEKINLTVTDTERLQVAWRNCPETLRFALATVHARGAGFRRRLIRKAINPFAAAPLEAASETRPVVYLAWKLEKGETRYRVICTALCLSAVATYIFDARPVSFFLLYLITAICGLHRSRRETSPDSFSKTFNLAIADQPLRRAHPGDLNFGVGTPNQRVIVHKGFDPSRSLAKWSFTAGVGLTAATSSESPAIKSISISQLDAMMLGFGEIVRKIVAKGEDAPILPMARHTTHFEDLPFGLEAEPDPRQPNVAATDDVLIPVRRTYPNLARTYILFHDVRRDGELIVTRAIRTSTRGQMFYIEASAFLLAPLSREYKSVDRMAFRDDRNSSLQSHPVSCFTLEGLSLIYCVMTFGAWLCPPPIRRERKRQSVCARNVCLR